MLDSFKYLGKRMQMVKFLRTQGIHNEKVLGAISRVPRHLFIDSALENHAYVLKAVPIAAEQTLSNPYTVALQTQLIYPKEEEKILEIGTGSGYQTAVLLELGSKVYTIERQKELFDRSKQLLKKLSYYPKYQSFGDGFKGLPAFAPFDKIIVTAAAPFIPRDLKEQLKIGGLMIIPVGKRDKEQQMKMILREDEECSKVISLGKANFVPMLEKRQS
ncbi:protein-L-isoaspartate(D-aspartate) O-methyltransferase [Bacteroidetes bacterium endosymbiont of Geopemphigus sp.]|uniref:protein-L-isoaspartate(D-aspartate) O-methyltransferase n=1 Tax=Bacteroidetes bacterium endosymbiont of Geopemphigus sp. TaxID=2047937 RepID=UPI000CD2A592|nr:protein-L-isoaspartate(D-aspartate) O-methyltransferase [Bacteroidetes bacterium endosymbiont of Geopemphigus sp.]